MASTVSGANFVRQLAQKHGVVDVNKLSANLKASLEKAGVAEAELRKLAGPDGRIQGEAEFKKLFALLDKFEGKLADGQLALIDPERTRTGEGTPTAAGQAFEALKSEVDSNRRLAQYRAPGQAAPKQRRLLVEKDALVVPAEARKPPVQLAVKHISQFDLPNGNEACLRASTKAAEQFTTKALGKKAPRLDAASSAIQVAYAEDKNGHAVADPSQAKAGRAYIDQMLEKGMPVVVGVSHKDGKYNLDQLTDHFVTIVGRGYDDAGRLFYEYKDPGTRLNGGVGRFFVDKESGNLFKQGAVEGPKGKVPERDFALTQVRVWKSQV